MRSFGVSDPDEAGPGWSGVVLLALVVLVLAGLVFVGLPRDLRQAIMGEPSRCSINCAHD
ncbi:MAG TPA: hypothetical protein VES21_02250 [Nocardioidaceae bacterium]|nr:hypothetical protein [Nocardioidaceae bacterium]